MIKRFFLRQAPQIYLTSCTPCHTQTQTRVHLFHSPPISLALCGTLRELMEREGRNQEDSGSQSGPLHTFDKIKSKVKGESVCKRKRLWLGYLAPELNIGTCTVSKRNHNLMLASCTGLRPAFPTFHFNKNTANLKTDLRSAKTAFLPTPTIFPAATACLSGFHGRHCCLCCLEQADNEFIETNLTPWYEIDVFSWNKKNYLLCSNKCLFGQFSSKIPVHLLVSTYVCIIWIYNL